MEPKDPSSNMEQQPEPLEFTEPVCFCESTAHYTNPQGQEFELRVRGANSDLVQEYIKEVQIYLEVRPLSEEPPPEEEPPIEQDEKYKSLVEELYKGLKLQPELDLEIELEILNTQGIELPYVFNIGIDPSINGGQSHRYHAKVDAKKITVNLTASQNRVFGYLSGGGAALRDIADVLDPDPPKKKARYKWDAGAPSRYYFSVTGSFPQNKYSVGSSVTFERD